MTDVTAYPLAWPALRPRYPYVRASGQFRAGKGSITLPVARDRLSEQLDRLGASSVVLSTNLELTLNGQPRGGRAEPMDPGVACYFQFKGRPLVLSCDRWSTVAANIAAIAAHIEALRGQERWGIGTIEQAFAGYAALPAPISPDDWRPVLGNPPDLAAAEAAYRTAMRTAHPDAGGSNTRAAALNAAIERARKELR